MILQKTIIPYVLFMLLSQIVSAQFELKPDHIKNSSTFTMYGDNYFVTGTSLNKKLFGKETSDAKFEIGFKQRINNIGLPWDIFMFVGYRQKSFWDIYKKSSPFREINYNPSVGFVKLFADNNFITDGFWIAFEHESNGRDEENSRNWNFISLTYFKPLGRKWQLRSKIWFPVGKRKGNEDIISYRGYFSVGTSYNPVKNLFIDIDVQPAFKDRLTGFVKLALSFKVLKNRNQFLYLQYFGGYSEDLVNYNKYSSNLRIGIAVKHLFANFRQ